jgi:amino acid adenylation domain-containing protein
VPASDPAAAATVDPPAGVGDALAALGRGPRPGYIAETANAEDCIHRRFERQVARDPAAIAIHFEGEDWTYETLDHHANRLAAHLQGLGVGTDVLVGIHMERGPWLLAGILGILKAGGAYVPLDPAFPAERLEMIGEDAALRVLLTEKSLAGLLHVPGATSVLIGPESDFPDGPAGPVISDVTSEHLAYVMYTSGSTGKPKGVQIRHRSAVNLLCSMADEPGFGPGDSFLAVTTISFDISVAELFLGFIKGGRVVLAPRGVGADGEGFAAMLDEQDITLAQGTPTTWRLVLAAGWRGKKNLKIVIGGEAVDRDLAGKLMPLCAELWNFYGPTETTVWSTCLRMQPREGPVVIGRPLPGNDIYVLDEMLQPVAVGESGEICIGGDGVARGYANLPELTAEKFVPDPFSSHPEALMYRTGDLGRWHADGNLECQGRADHQVKVRGYRIELGEIESVLKEHPQVRDGVVVVHEPVPGDQRLTAYLIPDGETPTREILQAHLAGRLPDYMIPTAFEALESFPMTPNQKIDRKALAARGVVSQKSFTAPVDGSPAEIIGSIWQHVLNLAEVGIDDSVFKLGAHSMHVARVHAELKRRFEKRITVAQIFQHPTPRSLAEYFTASGVNDIVKRKSVSTGTRDIAIVGMSARFAGSRNLDEYWRNIRDGVESIRDFSEEELLAKGVSSELLADKRYVRRGCVLEDHDCFDAGFFDMSPREAELTNPQHRVFLQAAWEALEHAGYVPESFDGSIGLYAGSGHNSHAQAHPGLSGPEYLQTLVGNEQDYLTTRTAFKLGLNGPALNIQTACSTSLVAIHAACQALLDGQCDMAVAGGVSISWPEGQGYLYEDGLIFSPDGICRAFDAKAAGTVFGHGVGLVTLKPLDQAKADGDTIHAVIRGIAINNDGMRKGSFAAPSIEGQAEVIVAALAQQGIDPESIGLMEAHGTGTAVGDPIELAGLTQAYRRWTGKKQFCALGSVKNNIGHTDAAAGVAGLVKAVLALRHRQLPPILHYETPNPGLDLENSPFHVQTGLADWTGDYPRRAAVSSFGLGGTNAHAVLEEYVAEVSAGVSRPFRLLPFSARSEASFGKHTGRWIDFLKRNPDVDLSDAAFTLQLGRAAFEKRGFIVAESAADALERFENGGLRQQSTPVMEREVVFLFTGQGAQYPGMARATYFNEPVFSRELDRCSELLEPLLGIRLIDALYPEGDGPDLNQTSLAQPALFAVSYAQAKLWMSWGVKPACMLGHSIGEYVAAVLAGVFSLEDALRLVAERGRLMQSMEPGTMLAVTASLAEVERLLENQTALDLAACNAPELCVVAGPAEAVSAFARDLEGRGIASRPLHTSHAFHSRMMDGMLEEFTALVSSVARQAPEIPYVSNVTGDWISAAQAQDPAYYAEHIRRTVRFSQGVTRVLEKPKRLFLEMGPGRTLATLVGKHVKDAAATVSLATMPGPQDETPSSRYLMEALGKAWSGGMKVDWRALYANESRRRIPLPTYPFDEKRYRLDAPVVAKNELGKQNNLSDWFYSPGWRRQPAAAQTGVKSAQVWMTLGPVPEALVRKIEARGDRLIDATSRIRPGSEMDVAAFLSDCGEVPDQILIGWTLEGGDFQPQPEFVDLGRARTVETIEALARAWGNRKPVTVHFLTREFHDVLGGERAQPQWSFLFSSCLVATQEYPGIRCRQLDFDGCDDRVAEMVLAECLAPDAEPSVAWRHGRRWVRDHAQVALEKAPPILRQGGVYLITGGLGRVGLLFAEHLVRTVGAKVVLVGRSGMPPQNEWESLAATGSDLAERLLKIGKLGGEVLVLKADVASREELARAVAAAESRFGRIHGIIHAAGIVSSQTIGQSSPDELKRFLHAKTGGVLAVYQEAVRIKPDFCLLTSSLSAVLGGLGYHAYAAGNAFLDQFARWANQHSDFPWMSVNWDAWKFPDDDATAGLGSAMYRLAMTPEESLRVLDRVLAHPEMSRHGWVISTAPLAPRLEQWVHGPARRETAAASDSPVSTGSVIERMLEIWKHCLRREVTADDDYFDLGGDSLMAVGLFREIERQFCRALPMSSLFKSPTPARLALLLADEEVVEPVKETVLPSHVIAIRKSGARRPLFCIHGADGGVMFYREFALQLDEDRPFYAIEAPMLQDLRLNALGSVAEIAKVYLEEIRRIQPEGPYLLGGYSFGGLVAYEMARQLKAVGVETSRLLLFDTPNPLSEVRPFTLAERVMAQWRMQGEGGFIRKLAGLGKRVAGGLMFRVRFEIENRRAATTTAAGGDHLRHVQSRLQHDALYDVYQPVPYDGATCLFIAQEGGGDKFAYAENLGWNGVLTGDFEVIEVPGSHLEIFREPNLAHLLAAARVQLSRES